MAESLAVRYRPRKFADVAGQKHVTAVLRSAASRKVPPQQILLAGPSGLGKTTTARIFAAALMCGHRSEGGDACGLCDSCLKITGPGGNHPDVIELDAASNGGKDEIRDLAERAILAPMESDWKVYIVDEAHGLTGPGGQAFLRLLEEPPGHCLFILATTDPGKLPVALRGRCLNLEVLPPNQEETLANLRRIAAGEDWELEEHVAAAVVAASDPTLGMRGTVMTLDKLAAHLEAGRELTHTQLEDLLGVIDPTRLDELTDAILEHDRARALTLLDELGRRTGRTHLRRQLTAWAYEQLTTAAAAQLPMEGPLFRYATFVEAPQYDGALTIAVARAASPELDDSAQAVRALLEEAHATLDALASATRPGSIAVRTPVVEDPSSPPEQPEVAAPERHSPAPATAPAPAAPAPPPTAAPKAQAPPAPAPAVRQAPDIASETPGVAPATGESAAVSDPDVVAVLNAVGKISGTAAFVLRRCHFSRTARGLVVSIPPAQAPKAAANGLPAAIEQVHREGLPVTVAA